MNKRKTKTLMKQVLVLMAILLLISACSDANKPEVEQVQEGETIEEITEEEESAEPSSYQVTKERGYDCGVYEKEYDSDGNLITHTQFDRDALASLRTEYEYDGNGNVIKETTYDSDGSIISLSEYEYEYDSANNIIKRTSYHNGSVLFRNEYEYDSKGNQTKEIRYNSDGSFTIWNDCEYEYDSNENLVKLTHFNSDGSIIYWNEYEYIIEGDEIIRIVKSYGQNGDSYEPCESQA